MEQRDPVLRQKSGVMNSGYRSGPVDVKAVGGLHFIKSNGKPHFSLCGEVISRGRDVAGGQLHDLLLKLWPELKPLADLHLCDIDGVPMHCAANGLYYVQHLIPGCSSYGPLASSFAKSNYGPDKSDDECIAIMAKHFRLSDVEASNLMALLIGVANSVSQYERVWGAGSKPVVKAALDCWVESQKPRWKAEAEKCIADLGLVVFGDRYEVAA